MPRSAPRSTPFNRALQDGGAVQQHLDPATHHGAAMLDHVINQQAQIIAYVDDYKLMIFTTLPAAAAAVPDAPPERLRRASRGARGDGLTTRQSASLGLAAAGFRRPPPGAAAARSIQAGRRRRWLGALGQPGLLVVGAGDTIGRHRLVVGKQPLGRVRMAFLHGLRRRPGGQLPGPRQSLRRPAPLPRVSHSASHCPFARSVRCSTRTGRHAFRRQDRGFPVPASCCRIG